MRHWCRDFFSFTAICPNCKFYTPAEEGQKFLSQKKGEYLTWFNVFRGLLPVCLFHILQQETLKVHISAMQMSALLQHQALKSIAHRAHCSWILSFRWNWRLWRLERPKICQAQRLLEVQYLQIRYQVVLPGGGPPRSTAEQCSAFPAVFEV